MEKVAIARCGSAVAVNSQKAAAQQTFGVRPLEPLARNWDVILLGTIAVLACGLAARHAARINPGAILYEK